MKPPRILLAGLVLAALTAGGARGAESPGAPGNAAEAEAFFGLTNLWTFHLTVSPSDWQLLGSRGGPQERGMGMGMGMRSFGGGGLNEGGPIVFEPPPGGGPVRAPEPPPGFLEGLIRRFRSDAENPAQAQARPQGQRSVAGPGQGQAQVTEGRISATPGGGLQLPQAGVSEDPSAYPWATCTFEADGVTLTNVSLRFKGVSSMVRAPNGWKRPLKLDFRRGAAGRRYRGLETFSLNNNVNDATQMREALAYDCFRRAGLPAPRTAFARVYLTVPGRLEKRLLGLYTIIEAVEDEFLERSFGTRKGLLMKPEMMRGVQYFGDDWRFYAERYHPREPKDGLNPEVPRRFIEFLKFIQRASPEEFATGLGRYLEPEPFARFVALNAILANVDSFIGNGHNYYLHVHPETRKAFFVPWDLNESFGMHPVSGPSRAQMQFSVLRPNADPNQLVERFVTDATLGPLYRAQCAALLTNVFVASRLATDIDRIAAATQPVVFAESKRARADFERTVLGTLRPDEGDTSQPRHDREFAGDGYMPWPFPDAVEVDNLPLKAWVAGRETQVRDQLEGRTRGTRARPRLNMNGY